ncbi:nucleoside diphosphate kinase [Holotrichia oblita]|uniref:Nucleoside diphosphate kinase n=1 Tax=Holotrichia oblita TaxID=644536 RepID=A0ACB9TRD4_HOLOL|nr:nucleoside diphosphate kinase [Holotrichia oblita]
MNNRTFTIIKPDAVAAGKTGRILDMMIGGGFTLRAMRMTRMSREDAEKFYAIHRDRPFFGELVDFMTSGPVVVAVLEKEDAVKSLRELAGNTDPAKAAEGTIRRLYGTNVGCNAVHASDSDENAVVESGQFFGEEMK